MGKSVKVNIDGKEYSIRGENEEHLLATAAEVNRQVANLKSQLSEYNRDSLFTLAALNLAEKNLVQKNEFESDMNYLASELEKITEFLNSNLESLDLEKKAH